MQSHRFIALAAAVAATPLAAGACYDYVPLRTVPAALPVRDVQLALTDSGAVVLARLIGPASTAVDGTLVGDSAGSYVVAVRQVRRRADDPTAWKGEHVSVPRPLVASVTERRLSRTRTTLVAIGAAAGIVLARTAISGVGGSNAGQNGTGGVGGPK